VAWVEKVGKRWRGCFRDADGKKRSMVHTTRTDARNWAHDREAEVRGGSYLDPRAGALTFEQYVERWLRTYRRPGLARIDHVRRVLRLHLNPAFGAIPLRNLTPRMIQEWVYALSDQGRAPGSVRGYAQTLSMVLNAAVDDDLLSKSPYRKIDLPALGGDERRFLTPEEADRLIAELPSRYKGLVILALTTGARWGELTGLQRDRYNPLRGTITITRSLHEHHTLPGIFALDEPKTPKSWRTLTLPRHAVAVLNSHLDTYGTGRWDLVFTGPRGAPLARSHFRNRVFRPACVRAGITGLRFHDLRHTHASWLLADGIPVTAVSRRLGHANVSMTLDTYSHVMPETGDVLLAVLDRRLPAPTGLPLLGAGHGADGPPSLPLGNRTGT
jgi:integrase